MNNYWQQTMLLQCTLQGVRYEFLQLCVDLCRCYAPTERHLYYEEDPAIGDHLYLAANRQRERREREKEMGMRAGAAGRTAGDEVRCGEERGRGHGKGRDVCRL